jgi:hypothetical protein
MWQRSEQELLGEELFLAGERVLPGIYRQVGGGREIRLDEEDFLPASLDGRVACYMRVKNTWGQMAEQTAVAHSTH